VVRPAQQRSRHLAPGDKLGKYDLIRQIAVGGMAELYLARTVGIEGFEKLVVVKRILPQYVQNANFVNMFLNEARLAATLHHPNIAQVYDIGLEEGDYFFAMEYVHGEDLDRISSTSNEQGVPMSFDAALTLVAGLCAGLHYAHEKLGPDGKPLDVVHRDVSPSNVLVSYDGAVKLVDFGIARASARSTTTQGGLKGKIAYMSPEQCRAKTTLDRRSDIFSVGTILYELTTGRMPFTGESEYAVLNQIVNDDVPAPSTIVPEYPPALEKIVMRALARDPDQRYATAVSLQQHIEDFAHENRLRVSPLVLARLMSTLFPARLEEWDEAKTQGAFFVEQHVVRTLIESGKTGENAPMFSAEETTTDTSDTAVAPPPIMAGTGDTLMTAPPVGRIPSLPGRIPLGTPPAAVQPPPTPPSQMPRATPARTAGVPAPTQMRTATVQRQPTPVRAATPSPHQPTPPAALPSPAHPRAPTPPVGESRPPIARQPTPPVVESRPPIARQPTPPVVESRLPIARQPTPPVGESRPPIARQPTPPVGESRAHPIARQPTPSVGETRAPTPVPHRATPVPGTMQPPQFPTPVPGSLRTPPPGTLRSPAAVPGMPGSVPIVSMSQSVPGTLISTHGLPDAVVQRRAPSAADVTERVRIPSRLRSETSYINIGKRLPIIAVAAGGAVILGIVMFVALHSPSKPAAKTEKPQNIGKPIPVETKPAIAEPAKVNVEAVAPVVVEKPQPPIAPPVIEAVEPIDPPVEKPPVVEKTQPPRPKVVKVVKPHPKPPEPIKATAKPDVKPKPKIEPKEKEWNVNSPFLPVRGDKH
jgi:serine/threonine protein kinase